MVSGVEVWVHDSYTLQSHSLKPPFKAKALSPTSGPKSFARVGPCCLVPEYVVLQQHSTVVQTGACILKACVRGLHQLLSRSTQLETEPEHTSLMPAGIFSLKLASGSMQAPQRQARKLASADLRGKEEVTFEDRELPYIYLLPSYTGHKMHGQSKGGLRGSLLGKHIPRAPSI